MRSWRPRTGVERRSQGTRRFTLSLQEKGKGDETICLVTIAYPGLRVDQIKVGYATSTEEYPTVPVYLAREVIRFHFGSVHVGQGIDGPELMIALALAAREADSPRSIPVAASEPREERRRRFKAPGDSPVSGPDAFPASA